MPWQQLTLRIAANELPRTEALLRLAGAESVAISDAEDVPILEPAPGTTPLWPRLTVRALFAGEANLSAIASVLAPAATAALELEPLNDDELAQSAAQIIRRVEIGPRLSIVPAEEWVAEPGAVGLHMGLAFGTGQHPTTRLCLQWLEGAAIDGHRVLDYGCGTGVLALAALELGAREAWAVDQEPQALEATRRNAALNDRQASISIAEPDAWVTGPFDLILANILAQPLMDLAARFAELQPPGGIVVLSGILQEQMEALETHYARWYAAIECRELDGWGLMIGRRRNGYDR